MTHFISATSALELLHRRELTGLELAHDYLQKVAETEESVQAWEYLDPDYVLAQAAACDVRRHSGENSAPLLGIPVGIKDVFATVDMPTGWGTPIHAGKRWGYDAAVVERLRQAGAVIMGKTVINEYATGKAGKTRNPHNLNHTPGSSSSGSAAAVAAGMVPLAIGTQAVGSVLRPAAYCGILGFKPTLGTVSRFGALPGSRALEHVGFFARTIEDLGLVFRVLVGADTRDPDCVGGSDSYGEFAHRSWIRPPKFALIRGPFWQQADAEAQATLLDSAQRVANAGAEIQEVDLPSEFAQYMDPVEVYACQALVAHHGQDFATYRDQMSPKLVGLFEKGVSYPPLAQAHADRLVATYCLSLAKILSSVDAILTPVTTGAAPLGLENTGSPIFCALWSLLGLPAISLPIHKNPQGLPLGIQVVAARGQDLHLLGIASWLLQELG